MKKIFIFSLIALLSSQAFAHKFYMSITEMRYNEKNKSLEVTIKLFTDDIEKALESKSDSALFLGTEKEASQTDQLMEAYLREHFSLKQNEETMQYD
jgi:hypothetical protein